MVTSPKVDTTESVSRLKIFEHHWLGICLGH